MSETVENELIEVAMQIILHAGDARIKTSEALAEVKKFNFEQAYACIKDAKECIRKAHIAQTEVIQDETRGKTYAYSLLFTHAQDTLMTINSEVKLANEMIELFQAFYHKMEANA